jgi:uncharacterized protein YceH (UPF0502 family)
MRYAHNVGKVLGIPPQSVALLAVMFLRGAQTAGELRINSDRLHKFGDILSVEAFLNELAERREGALVRELPKQPGSRETRWAHLVSGEPQVSAASMTSGPDAISVSELAAMKANLDQLQSEVAGLKETVAKISRELGIG